MPTVRQAREALGDRLRKLRKTTRLNGKEFAQSLGWGATKVSKIENGKQTPSEDDIRTWAAATGHATQVPSLLAQLKSLELAYAEWRAKLRAGTQAQQLTVSAREASASMLRVFEPSTVPGLLQTPEYARSILTQVITTHHIPDDLDQGVQARMDRQRILYQPGKRLHFVLTESVLRNLLCPPEVMMGQIDRLTTVGTLPSVALGVIPWTVRLPKTPVHGFWIYDEELVTVETFSAELSLIQPEEIDLYGRIFQMMQEAAVYGREARAVMARVLDDLAAEFFPGGSSTS
ncbi:helix-turn-helix transcriptional regulator [Planomonospora sp. ID67723]|uniref:helix-turn-helix domain-containing protein n=1 Tax=Planomonospora sp. ID67723 TaxID=2738134 RepID=UPI0018C42619|nr:helix-turn-helix transcriptional regulator [Planomonospora sp. ID67723]MBG0826908.1 helix-turn-helix transcriptional regulator [Planomonospora sp. ID67723]